MHFQVKNTLENNRNYNLKHSIKLLSIREPVKWQYLRLRWDYFFKYFYLKIYQNNFKL
jgi:hypothetical protein